MQPPPSSWSRPLGLGWDHPYTVRYPSNLDDGPWHGAPLGGFGAGCLGRSPRGDFNLWHLDGGEHTFRSLPPCQLGIFEQGPEQPPTAYALSTQAPLDGTLSQWSWYPASTPDRHTGTYHALYPRSWFTYQGVFKTQVTWEQFSPIWAHNYRETSYPVALFACELHNPTDQELTVSVLFTWPNLVGWFTNTRTSPQVQFRDDGSPVYEYQPAWGDTRGHSNRFLQEGAWAGFVLEGQRDTPLQEGQGQWSLATMTSPGQELFCLGGWDPQGEEIWPSFSRDGSLSNRLDSGSGSVALAVRLRLPPGATVVVPFALAWDLPVTEFARGIATYRRYTDFFGRQGNQAWSIAKLALSSWRTWQAEIVAWQAPILGREDLPDWLKMALFNELYLLTQGGTLWSCASPEDPQGQFGVLECLDYRWYESLDVRLYGSFGLLLFWPELEKSVLRAFARAIPTADPQPRGIGYYYAHGLGAVAAPRKVAGATPHDLGAPNEDPWNRTNYTSYQDCNLWKDLPADFVLQVYRDFRWTGDREFLSSCWPAVWQTLGYLKTFDLDGDGVPENGGAPDQTFDDWQLVGVSAYCGGLWIAALSAALAMGEVLGVPSSQLETLAAWRDQAQQVYQHQLWNGQYYRLDSQSGSDVVMADQLCGEFYARLLGLPAVVPPECAALALETVYQTCFIRFNEYLSTRAGTRVLIGAANGVRPNGEPENPQATHPLEVWTGINFGLAAFCLLMGKRQAGLDLAQVVVKQVYDHGLQFRTPEAITAQGTFRASHYLRAMAIWLVYLGFDAQDQATRPHP